MTPSKSHVVETYHGKDRVIATCPYVRDAQQIVDALRAHPRQPSSLLCRWRVVADEDIDATLARYGWPDEAWPG